MHVMTSPLQDSLLLVTDLSKFSLLVRCCTTAFLCDNFCGLAREDDHNDGQNLKNEITLLKSFKTKSQICYKCCIFSFSTESIFVFCVLFCVIYAQKMKKYVFFYQKHATARTTSTSTGTKNPLT